MADALIQKIYTIITDWGQVLRFLAFLTVRLNQYWNFQLPYVISEKKMQVEIHIIESTFTDASLEASFKIVLQREKLSH